MNGLLYDILVCFIQYPQYCNTFCYFLTIYIRDDDITSSSAQFHHNVTAHYPFRYLFCASMNSTIRHTFCFLSASKLPSSGIPQLLFTGAVLREVYHRFSGDHDLWLLVWGSLNCFYGVRDVCRLGSADPSTLCFHDNNFIFVWPKYPAVCLMDSISGGFLLLLFLFQLFRFCCHTQVIN